jgi:tetratricopeptide (TPR) repeat protein
MTHPNSLLQQAEEFYERCLYVSAFRAAEPLGKLGKWPGVRGRLMAGRLAYQLGRAGWGTTLYQLAFREYPNDPAAIYYGALAARSRRGPLRAWLEFRWVELPSSRTSEQQADWLAYKGSLLASLRDFDRAQKFISQSLELYPTSAWNHLVQADLCRHRDQRDEAIANCRKALELHATYRPAIQTLAELLLEANRDEEAYSLLKNALASTESPLLNAQLILLCQELEKHDETLELLNQYQALAILTPTKPLESWINMMRARALYLSGKYEEAIPCARKADIEHCTHFAKRLEETLRANIDPKTCRVRIPVSFVRQNRSTCAPATLAALSDYWQKPIKHEEIAERICYDGTLGHDERRWATENGFVAREFCITGQAAHDLINAGIPFSLTTLTATSGHLQAVVGYDSIGEDLLIRDPSSRSLVEATTGKLLEYYASSGPRGMLMIPHEQAAQLDAITLPEADLYDLQYEIDSALSEHRRDDAMVVLKKMQQQAPDHRLTLQSEFSLRRYDGNNHDCLRITQKLLEKFPKDLRLVLNRLDYCHEFGSRGERIELLQNALNEFGPAVRLKTMMAEEYLRDAREYRRAESELRWLLRWASRDSHAISLYGQLAWKRQRYSDSVELLRIAACSEEKSESHAQAFFNAAIRCRETQSAITWLLERHQLWGKQNCGPSLTLAWAYEVLQDISACLNTLREAIQWRPDDGYLLCNAALYFDRYGEHQEARRCMEVAAGKVHRAELTRTQATLSMYEGDLVRARMLLEELLNISPSDSQTLDMLLDLDLQLENAVKGEQRLRDLLVQWPQNTSLQERLVTWLRQFRPEGIEAELDKALKNDPNNTWLHREAAIAAIQRSDIETAKHHVNLCLELEPNLYRNWSLRGQIHFELGDRQGVREAAIQSLKLWIDNNWAMNLLISTCRSEEEFAEDFGFLLDQLRTQATMGDGVLSYYKLVTSRRDARQVLDDMREAHRSRPELWQSWSGLIKQYVYVGMTDEAFELGKQFTERFPFLVESWLEFAAVCFEVDQNDLQREALERALQLNPTSAEIARQLSDLYLAREDVTKAIEILKNALAANPRDAVLHAYLADIQWSQDQKEDAIESMRRAVTLYPGYHWAWDHFGQWCHEMHLEELAFETANSLCKSKLTETWGDVRTAELHLRWDRLTQAQAVANAGLERAPMEIRLYEVRIRALSLEGKIEEALAACRPTAYKDDIPAELMFLESDIEFRRGKIQEAIKRQTLALDIAPGNYTQWRSLLEWTEEHSEIEKHFQLCEKFVSLFPSDAVAHGFHASTVQKLRPEESIEECIDEYQLALRLDPNYAFAAFELFFLYLKAGRIADAQQLQQNLPDELAASVLSTLSMWISCFASPTDLLNVLRQHINESFHVDVYSLRRGLDCINLASWRTAVEKLWQELPNLRAIGVMWAETMARKHEPTQICDVLQHLPTGEAWFASWESLQNMPLPFQIPVSLIQDFNKRFRKIDAERAALESAIRYSPNSGDLIQKLADTYLECGENEKAIEVLKGGLEKLPFEASIHAQLAGILWSQSQKHDAIEAMRLAVTLNPSYSWAWDQFGKWCYETRAEKTAFDAARSLVQVTQTRIWGHIRTAELHLRWRRPKRACESAIDGLNLAPNDVRLRELYARSLHLSGRTGEALEVCRPSITAHDVPVELIFLESEIQFQIGNITESIKRHKLALDKKPANYEQWCSLLRRTSEQSSAEEHFELCKRFLSLFPSDAAAHVFYATALRKCNPIKSTFECIEKFQAALRFDSNNALAALQLFFLYIKIGRISEAQKLLSALPQSVSTRTRSTMDLWLQHDVTEVEFLPKLCRSASQLAEVDPLTLKCGLEVLNLADRQLKLDKLWKEEPNLGALGIIWAELNWREMQPHRILDSLRTLPVGNAWLAAWETLLCMPSSSRFPVELAHEINRQFKALISMDARAWAAVAKYYRESKNLKILNEWTRNWRNVPVDNPQQLIEAIRGQWLAKNVKEARQMLSKAASIPAIPPDPHLLLWDATCKIYEGQGQQVVATLQSLQHITLDDWYVDLREQLHYLALHIEALENLSSRRMRLNGWAAIAVAEVAQFNAIPNDWKQWYLRRVKENTARRFKLWATYIDAIFERVVLDASRWLHPLRRHRARSL